MDSLEEIAETSKNNGFLKSVFMIDKTEKGYLMNIIQYTLLAIVPVIVILKLLKNYVPDVDDEQTSLVMSAEVLAQVLFIMVAIFFIHRIIIYIPTYSGLSYGNVDLTNIIIIFLFIIFTMQTKLGEKVQILIERLMDLFEGKTSLKDAAKKETNNDSGVKVIQPISNQYISNPTIEQMLTPQMTNIKSQTNEYSMPQQTQQQSSPNFNNMYAGPNTPMVGASTPGDGMTEPMAANAFGGGSFGSSW
jgi:hypothetical protein